MADRSSPGASLHQSSTCPVQRACAEFLEAHAAFLALCEQDDNVVDVAAGLERRRLAMISVRAQTARTSEAVKAKTRVLQTALEVRGDDADADVTEFTLEVLREVIQLCSDNNHLAERGRLKEVNEDRAGMFFRFELHEK